MDGNVIRPTLFEVKKGGESLFFDGWEVEKKAAVAKMNLAWIDGCARWLEVFGGLL